MRNAYGLDAMVASIEVRLSVRERALARLN